MVDVELYYDGSTPVSHFDPEGLQPSTATLAVIKPDGTTLSAPVVTKPTLSTTTQAGTTAAALVLAAVTGLSRGKHLAVTSDGVTYVCEVARVDTLTVHLTAALPLVPDAGSAVKNLDMTASVAAPGTANLGEGLRLAWTYDDGTTTRRVSVEAFVVRWPWQAPVTGQDVRELVAFTFGESRAEGWCARIADRVNDRIRAALVQTGRRPYLYLSAAVFKPAAELGIRWILAEEGICVGGQVFEAQRELRFAFTDSMTTVVTSARGYDTDEDGQLSSDERRPKHWTIQAVR